MDVDVEGTKWLKGGGREAPARSGDAMNETPKHACPICGAMSGRYRVHKKFAHGVECPVCGTYEITEQARGVLQAEPGLLPGLSAYIREANRRSATPTITSDKWQQFAQRHVNTPVRVKLERLLTHLALKSDYPGSKVTLNSSHDYPLFDAAKASEVRYLVETLKENGYLKYVSGSRFIVTASGWERIDPMWRSRNVLRRHGRHPHS